MKRIALTSSSSVSFLSFFSPEKGDPNCGMPFSFLSSFRVSAQRYRFNEDENRAAFGDMVPMKSGHDN